MGIPTVLGPILGPVIGAIILQFCSWRVIFFINIPVGILAIIIMTIHLPNFTPSNVKAKFDFIGITLLGAASATLIYGIAAAAKNKTFSNFTTLEFIIIGVIILVAYVIYAAFRKEQAILPLRLFRAKSYSASTVGIFLAGIATNGPMLLLPLFFQNVKSFDVIYAGLILIPQGIGMLIARPLIGKMTDKIGARKVVLVSLAFAVVGTVPFIFIDLNSSLIPIGLVLLIRGVGIGGVTIPMMTDAYTGLEGKEVAQASVGSRIVQNLGGAFGSAVLATIVSLSLITQQVTSGVEETLTHEALTEHLTVAYHDGFILALILSLVMIIPALFLTNKKKQDVE